MGVVVDEHLEGWTSRHHQELIEKFQEVRAVGDRHELPRGIKDGPLAAYCKRENCLLVTCDRKIYVNFFVNGTETIQIRTYGINEDSGQTIYLVSVEESTK